MQHCSKKRSTFLEEFEQSLGAKNCRSFQPCNFETWQDLKYASHPCWRFARIEILLTHRRCNRREECRREQLWLSNFSFVGISSPCPEDLDISRCRNFFWKCLKIKIKVCLKTYQYMLEKETFKLWHSRAGLTKCHIYYFELRFFNPNWSEKFCLVVRLSG